MTTKRVAIFCCEASLEIGTGHVMRCLVLAKKILQNDWNCQFVSSQNSYNLIPQLQNFTRLDPQQFLTNPQYCDLLIVDNYSLDESYEKPLRKFAKKILVIDDLANRRHFCDILLDQNLATEAEEYKNLVNEECKILAGTKYSLLREEFAQMRPKALNKRLATKEIKKILVNFGGSDLKNHTIKALQEIEKSNFLGEVEVVLGFNAVHFDEIEKFSHKTKNKITLHRQANMAQLIYEADLAFAAGGTSAWERCCLGLPTYLVKIADNQEKIFKELGHAESFAEFYTNASQDYQKYVAQIASYVDGAGADRVLQKLLPNYEQNSI